MRKDLKNLGFAICIILLTLALTLPSFLEGLSLAGVDTKEQQKSLRESKIYSFKEGEADLWASIKGVKSDKAPAVATKIEIVTPTPPPIITPTPIVEDQSWKKSVNVLIIGDSMMLEGFGPKLESDLLKFNILDVTREGKYSTGLNRVDYFDWYKRTQELITQYKPNVIIVMFGANDGQDIIDEEGNRVNLFAPEWDSVYTQRVNKFMQLTSTQVKKVYWIGHPIAKTDDFKNKFKRMNAAYDSQSKLFKNVTFIPTWDRFAVNGEFSLYVEDNNGLKQIAKSSDGVHVTEHGGKILSGMVTSQMEKDLGIVLK